jgi:hypothetical protein
MTRGSARISVAANSKHNRKTPGVYRWLSPPVSGRGGATQPERDWLQVESCSPVIDIHFDELLLTECQNRVDSRSSRGRQICRGHDDGRHGRNHDDDRQAVCGGDSE